MYICVSSIGQIKIGETVMLQKDELFDELTVRRLEGEVIGCVAAFPVEGCVTKRFLKHCLAQTKLFAKIIIKSGDIIILHSENRAWIQEAAVPVAKENTATLSNFNNF